MYLDKFKEIVNDWNYDARRMLTLLLILDLENFKPLIFVAQSLHKGITAAGKRVLFVSDMMSVI
jgi:hypothetical protein